MACFPTSSDLEIFCDFDGTITQVDATDALLDQFAEPQWRQWEALWQAGEISGRECLKRQVGLIRANRAEIAEFMANLPIDRGILALAEQCARIAATLTIVSDGLDIIVEGVLRQHGLHLPSYANHVVWESPNRLSVEFPYMEADCESGTCKCRLTHRPSKRVARRVYVGDGRSDFCVTRKMRQVGQVYAKGALIGWCRLQGIPFHPFDRLEQVVSHLCPVEAPVG